MNDIDIKTVLKYAAMALAAYLIYEKFIAPMMLENGKTDEGNANRNVHEKAPMKEADPAHTKPLPPAGPTHSAPPLSVVPGEQQRLATALQSRAAVATLSVDGWNYYLREVNPNAVVTDLEEVGVKRSDKMNVAQFLALRTQAGLTTVMVSPSSTLANSTMSSLLKN